MVTAASSGIGLGVAKWLTRWGARVAIASRNPERLKEAAAAIEREAGARPITIVMDLMDGVSVRRGFEEAWDHLGAIDLLVVNTGNIGCEPCTLDEAGYGDWLEAALMHLVAPGYLTSLYISKARSTGGRKTIVYLSSASVREPMRFLALADAARAGLSQLARIVARVYGSEGLRAYTILLGSFDTPGARKLIERIAERMGIDPHGLWEREVLGRTPLRRTGSLRDLAALIAFLASPYADYMSGSTIDFTGSMIRCV